MEGSPNLLAYFVLLVSPLVAAALPAIWRAPLACAIAVVGAQMFLPPNFELDAPLIPPLGKDVLPLWGLLLGCFLFRRKSLTGSRPWRGYDLLILLQVVGHFGTFLTNRDPIFAGPVVLPALTMHDVFSEVMKTLLYWWPPFYLGRSLYRTQKDLKLLLAVMAGAGVVYSFFLFIEMLMSPQLNRWIYGFHQSSFLQTIRWGGYRPKAFMRHGINVAIFMLTTLICATGLSRIGGERIGFLKASWVAKYLTVVLVSCKSLGAVLYGALSLPFLWFTNPKKHVKVLAIVAVFIFCYPLSRAVGLIPVDDINAFTREKFGADRSESLGLRLQEEGYVMGRALERPAFGWGGYQRPFRHDPYTGEQTTIIDGYWVLVMSGQGLIGYLGIFGMLLLPIWRAKKTVAKLGDRADRIIVTTLAAAMVVYVFDLIPNSSIDPYLNFLLGALAGTERWLLQPAKDATAPVGMSPFSVRSRYEEEQVLSARSP